MRRVRWKKEQFESTVLLFNKVSHRLGFMNRMPIDNKKDWLVHADQQSPKKLYEHTGGTS